MAEMTYTVAQQMVIDEEMSKNPLIWRNTGILLGQQPQVDKFGWGRVQYSGICETQIAGAAIGAALAGTRPIAEL